MGVRILYNSALWDGGTISASSEVAGLEGSNAIHDFVGKPWRSTGDTSETWTNDLGSATALTCFGMFNHNLTSSATVKLQANSSDSWGSPPFDQTLTVATDADGNVLPRLVHFPSTSSYRYWRIDIADASNPDGFVQVGRFMAGSYWEPTRTVTDGFVIRTHDPSQGTRAPGTGWFARQRNKYREADVGFELYNRNQHEKFDAVFSRVGQTKPLILALDPANHPTKDSMYCKVTSPLDQVFRETSLFDMPFLSFVEETE